MHDRWVGLEAGVDALEWARLLRRAHGAALEGEPTSAIVRTVIAASWERCSDSGVDPDDAGAPLAVDPDDARERWHEHPLARSTEILRDVLGDLLYDARHILVVSDADGCLLWSEGHPEVLRASERIEFTPGHAWSEAAAGTNAVGTALAADHAVQVFAAEHFRCTVHGWQCSGAPVHDPDTGETLGVVDVTGSYRTAHPHNLALVQMAARLVEERLRREIVERDARILERYVEHTARHSGPAAALSPCGRVLAATPYAWTKDRIALPDGGGDVTLADGTDAVAQPLGEGVLLMPAGGARRRDRPPCFRLRALGCERAALVTPTKTVRLTARHSEIAVLLALHPEGLSARELARLLYGEPGHEVALRAELHRLRAVVGPALRTRPYRLHDVETDVAVVRRLLAKGRRTAAAAAYAGALLLGSEVAAIVQARQELEQAVAPH